MGISNELIKAFVKSTNDVSQNKREDTFVYATVKKNGEKAYAMFDGSNIITPVSNAVDVSDGDRVMVMVKNHSGTIISNYTSPAVNNEVFGNFKTVTTDSIKAVNGLIDNLAGEYLEFRHGEFEDVKAKTAEFDELKVKQADFEKITADNFTAVDGRINNLSGDFASFVSGEFEDVKAKTAEIDIISGDLAEYKVVVAGQLSAHTAILDNLDAAYASVDLANIDTANINKAKVGLLFAEMGLISTAVIENGHVTGYLDSVEVNANRITAGTLSVDRLIINGSDKSLIYALNNAGELVSTSVDTLDGGLLTDRTITADKLVAHSITAQEITTADIIGASGWINLAQGTFNYGNQISWDGNELYINPDALKIVVDSKYATRDYVDGIKIGARNLIRNAKTLNFSKYLFGKKRYFTDENGTPLTDENGNYLIEWGRG